MDGIYWQKSTYSLHGGMFHAARPSLQIEIAERIMNGPSGELMRSSEGVDCSQQ